MTAVLDRALRGGARVAAAATGGGWRRHHFLLLVTIGALQALVRAETPIGQDAYWSARYGLDVLHSGHLPRVDTYSWTAHGRQWVPNSWLWNVVLGGTYDAAGVLGFWVVGAALSIGSALVVGLLARTCGAKPLPTIAVYAPIGMLGVEAIPRAQTLSNTAALVVAYLIARVLRQSGRRALRSASVLVAVQILWMNLHSMALLGPVLAGVVGFAVLAGTRTLTRHKVRQLVAITAVLALACLATPYGVLPITHAAEVRDASVGLVVEWLPAGFGSTAQILALLSVLGGCALAWRSWRGGRFGFAACIVVLAAATATAIRFLPMVAVAGTPELALLVGTLRVREQFMRIVVAAVAVVLAALAALGWRDLRLLEPMVSPDLVAAVPSGCRVLNDDLAGDALVLTRPDVSVSIDGRNDLYGRRTIQSVLDQFANRAGTLKLLRQENVGCVLGPSSTALVNELRHTAGWRVVAQDSFRTLLVRAGRS